MGSSFSQLVWTVFCGVLAEIYEHVEGHHNDSATILNLSLTSLRFDAGLLRNISTEPCHVLMMLTRRRAQRLVLKVAEPEGLEAYRLFLRRCEPVSMVTTVSKHVDNPICDLFTVGEVVFWYLCVLSRSRRLSFPCACVVWPHWFQERFSG